MIAGRYQLEHEIGRGGTGAVWLGRDDLLNRRVALKRIGRLPGADHTDVVRAEREARLSARLQHPHVVSVFDVVADEETGDHWLAMEYVDGVSLAQLVRSRGRLSPEEAAPLLHQAADGLVAAHAAGITHRDVKPSNVLVNRDGQVKITDFGIARLTTDAALTQTGLMTGSPAYLAPEVAAGGRGDHAADVWSLGATAYHLLAGRPPYDAGDHALSTLYRIVHDEPPRLDDAGPLGPLLAATMERDPARRWTMEQARDFLAGLDATPSVAEPVGAPADDDHTQVLARPAVVAEPAVAEAAVAEPAVAEAAPSRRRPMRPPPAILVGVAAVAAVVLLVAAYAALSGGGSGGNPGASSGGSSPTSTSTGTKDPGPTTAGMESFIRRYVDAVAADPDSAWMMLTPKFQRESGGLDHYRRFWDAATAGRVLSITANPADLSVSYQVHFDHFHNGPGPTVLDLAYRDGRYLIDGEHSRGFQPASD